jgi:hypothetical protein
MPGNNLVFIFTFIYEYYKVNCITAYMYSLKRILISLILFITVSISGSISFLFAFANTIHAQTLQGDANGDGKVDGIDFVAWLNHYNQNTANGARDGDFNLSGKVDGVDFVIWLNNYGRTATPTPSNGPTASNTVTPSPAPCFAGSTAWTGNAFTNQTQSFVATFTATPQASNITAFVGLSPISPLTVSDIAASIRFNFDGTIQAYNNFLYTSTQPITYTANKPYTFRLFINLPSRSYSAYVTPQGGTEQLLAQDFTFRSTQLATLSLGYWTAHSTLATDVFNVCGFQVTPFINTPTPKFTPTPVPDCYVSVLGYVYNLKSILNTLITDQTSGKTNTHIAATLQCGTLSNPTDITVVYLEKHSPLGCWQRIAPYIVTPPAPVDPTCQ